MNRSPSSIITECEVRNLTSSGVSIDSATPAPVSHAQFDSYVVKLLCQTSESPSAINSIYEGWVSERPNGKNFLDFLIDRGAIDRVGARGILLAWRGGLDDREMRQLVDVEQLSMAVTQLLPEFSRVRLEEVHFRTIGSRIGRYMVKGILGRGGFGPVYLAVHPTLRIPVALKTISNSINRSIESVRDRLRIESRLQASISHPHVIRVWDYEDGDEPLLVLEYVHGENLRERVSIEPLNKRDAFTLIVQIALGLRAAWRAGITHHDVKPANIMLTPENGFKIGDFGLARSRGKMTKSTPRDAVVVERSISGSLNFMAPEQFENCHDHRSDIYSLGLTAYYALSGRLPVPGTDHDKVMLRHKRGGLEPVHHLVPGIERPISDLISRMASPDPERRFESYDDLIGAAKNAFEMSLESY